MPANNLHTKYEVALSFAGAQRYYVDIVANELRDRGVSVFYDKFVRADMWGENLVEFLHNVYEHGCASCVLFVSKEYRKKVYPTHERRSAISDEVKVLEGRILQVKFDDTDLPGIPTATYYLKAEDYSPQELTSVIIQKLRVKLFPSHIPDLDASAGIALSALHDASLALERAGLSDARIQFEAAGRLIENNYLEDALFRVKRGLQLVLDEGTKRKGHAPPKYNKDRFEKTRMLFPDCYALVRFFWQIMLGLEYGQVVSDNHTVMEALLTGCEAVRMLSSRIAR